MSMGGVRVAEAEVEVEEEDVEVLEVEGMASVDKLGSALPASGCFAAALTRHEDDEPDLIVTCDFHRDI